MQIRKIVLASLTAFGLLLLAILVYTNPSTFDPNAKYNSGLKDEALYFITQNHPDAAPFLINLDWKYQWGGKFSSDGWILEIVNQTNGSMIRADYSDRSGNVSIPHRIIWEGSYRNGTIYEMSYVHAQ
uniref:Uncharacterized protein n=1 Tax=Candidatus Methanomethylicus mesodigestus TaxID=1867258 RepID=A0A7C3F207_9CREN